jgi:hypothetical protein
MIYFFRISILIGGIFMGLAALRSLIEHGFDLLIAMNMALYLGLGLYVLPKLVKLIRKK